MSIRKNTLWNLVGAVAPMALGLVVVPFLLDRLGTEAFGVLSLIWALIGYFSVFDFGVGRALTQQISACRASAAVGRMPLIITNGLVVVGAFGTVGGAGLAATARLFGYDWLNVNEVLQESVTNCLYIAALGIPLVTVMAGLRGVLEGLEEFWTANILRVVLGVANFGLPVVSVILLGPSLEYVVASLVIARAAVVVAHWMIVRRRVRAQGSAGGFDPATVMGLLSFGAWMTLSNVISPLMVTADRFVISYLLGAGVVAYYTVPFDFIVRLLVIPAALTSTLFPRFAHLFGADLNEFRRVYRKGLMAMAVVMLPMCLVLALGAHDGLVLWLGQSFAEQSWAVAAILAIGLLFNGVAQIPHAAIQAAGDPKATALLHALEFCIYVPALFWALTVFGLVGAALAWVARVLLDLAVLAAVAQRKMA